MKSSRYIVVTALLGLSSIAMAKADDVTMASGNVHFSTPSNWVGIMQVDGDPEVRVFQVPDPSPSAGDTLARVSVTVKQVTDTQAFSDYVNSSMTKAKNLKDYQPGSRPAGDQNTFVYTARESGTPYTYTERYWFRDGHAIQLRCARPSASQAGQSWAASFDQSCKAVAANLNG
ncbi:hypothetical protein [Dyella choica]|uniref:Uncharacterized protein n=1 Tax=Dyella choica TaxID=1927959 RepID=A0A432M373_9GAMM|nr:hypothetical protein [Dyella choica]RUL72943.1 hypothetical protein EKH80_16435 [Dyella choica]